MSTSPPGMGTISVQLTSGSWSTGTQSAAVAEISARSRSNTPPTSSMPTVSLGVNGAAKSVTVPAGEYTVRLYLPNGDVLAESISVEPAGKPVCSFELPSSPHEWLSEETAFGAVQHLPKQSRADALTSLANDIEDTFDPFALSQHVPRSARGSASQEQTAELLKRQAAQRINLAASGVRSTYEAIERISGLTHTTSMRGYRWLSQLDADRPFPPTTRLGAEDAIRWWTGEPAAEPVALMADIHDERNAKFVSPDVAGSGPPIGETPTRAFAAIRDPQGKGFYAVFPEGWRKTSPDSFGMPAAPRLLMTVVIDAVMQGPDDNDSSAVRWRCSPSVDDVAGMALLGFLHAGQTVAAETLLEQAQDALFEKIENPVYAAIGAFVLLGYSNDDNTRQRPRWRDWIRNLSRRFPFLPDGAVAEAQMYLRYGDGPSADEDLDIERLRELALTAVRRGLPYLSVSVKTLTEIMLMIVRDDEHAQRTGDLVNRTREAHRLVLSLDQLIEPSEFFCVLRVEE